MDHKTIESQPTGAAFNEQIQPNGKRGKRGKRAILVYFRPEDESVTTLDRIVLELNEQYRGRIHSVRVDTGRNKPERPLPMIRMLRDGNVVGEALGPQVPKREIERVVLTALRE